MVGRVISNIPKGGMGNQHASSSASSSLDASFQYWVPDETKDTALSKEPLPLPTTGSIHFVHAHTPIHEPPTGYYFVFVFEGRRPILAPHTVIREACQVQLWSLQEGDPHSCTLLVSKPPQEVTTVIRELPLTRPDYLKTLCDLFETVTPLYVKAAQEKLLAIQQHYKGNAIGTYDDHLVVGIFDYDRVTPTESATRLYVIFGGEVDNYWRRFAQTTEPPHATNDWEQLHETLNTITEIYNKESLHYGTKL